MADGGCPCGALHYRVEGDPMRVVICHCRCCQRMPGSDHLAEPIFDAGALTVLQGKPARFVHRSARSGQGVHVHFCAACSTSVWQRFGRWPGIVGLFGGRFDEPGWFEVFAETALHLHVASARQGTLIPAGRRIVMGDAETPEGAPMPAEIHLCPRLT